MPSLLKNSLIILTLTFFIFGTFLTMKPLYHYVSWKIRELKGKVVWEQCQAFQQSSTNSMKPAAWLEIPGLDIQTLVIQNTNKKNLLQYPCIILPDNRIDSPGLKLIMAHRDMHFRKLKNIRVPDPIQLELENGRRIQFTVVETQVLSPEKAGLMLAEKYGEDWLVLMTCYPFQYVGPAPQRFLVWARPGVQVL